MEIELNEKRYRAKTLPARRQFHMVRRLASVLSGLAKMKDLALADPMAALEPLAQGIASLSDADADYVIDGCLAVVELKQPAGGWAPVMVNGRLMFEDMDMTTMLRLTWAVLQENLAGFFAALPQTSSGAAST